MSHARTHDTADATASRRSAEVEAPEAPASPMPLPAAPVTSRPAPVAAPVSAPTSDAAGALGLQPAADHGLGSLVRRLHADRPSGQLSPDPAGATGEAGPPDPAPEGVENAFDTVGALVRGVYTGVSDELTPEVADALLERLQQSTLLNAVLPPVFLAGTVVGIAQDAVEAVRGVLDMIDMIDHLDELIAQATEILEIVVSPEGGELGRVLGEEIGRGWGKQLVDLSGKGVFEFTYELGKIAGPALVYTIASFVGLPAIAGAAVYARLSKALLPLMKRFPRLAKLATSLAKRLPQHQPHLPHAPRTPHAPHAPDGPHDPLPDGPQGRAFPGRAPESGGADLPPGRGTAARQADDLPGFDEAFREAPDADVTPVETRKTRSSAPTNPRSAAAIFKRIEQRMPELLAEFDKSPASGRVELDRLEQQFVAFMKDKRTRTLTPEERKAALEILGPAREHSRSYYNEFRDFAWERLNKDPELQELVAAPGSGAELGVGTKAAKLRVEVSDAKGVRSTQDRSIDFEHVTRVTDQPFRRHSGPGGGNSNLSPMLGDLNRYYQEALRNVGRAHIFGDDAVEHFIVQHQLYPKRSPALLDLTFEPVGN
jgi:hypothetical protein